MPLTIAANTDRAKFDTPRGIVSKLWTRQFSLIVDENVVPEQLEAVASMESRPGSGTRFPRFPPDSSFPTTGGGGVGVMSTPTRHV